MSLLLENLRRRWREFTETRLLVEQWRAVWTYKEKKQEKILRAEAPGRRLVGFPTASKRWAGVKGS